MTHLVTQSDLFCNQAKELVRKIGLEKVVWENENFFIAWSVAYTIALPWSDIDIYLVTPHPRERLIEIVSFIGKHMIQDKYLKKFSVNNFYDTYEVFDTKKKNLLKETSMKQFMITISYYHDDSLSEYTNIELHITDKKPREAFPALLTLTKEKRSELLEIKDYIQTSLPFFWNRSYLLYTWFLAWYNTKEKMITYLEEQDYKKLIK